VRSLAAWLRRWGISIASFVGGLLALFVFRRGLPHVAWIVGYLLLLWLLVTVLVQVRDTLIASDKRAHRLVLTATEYTVQRWTAGTLDSPEPVPGAIRAADLHERGLVARTAIYAPAGLRQPVEHVWRHDGQVVNVVRLTPVRGGRREGFRTFSRKTAFPAAAVGRWRVDVTTESGQLIGRLRFRVVP